MDKILVWLADVTVPTGNAIPEVKLNAETIGNALTAVFTVIGGMAVLFLLVGAVRYVTSSGDQAKITQAKNTILYAVIGIVVSLSAFTIVQFVAGQLSPNE